MPPRARRGQGEPAKQPAQKTTTAAQPSARRRAQSDFPKTTLEDAIRVPQAIEDANAGQPYPPTDAAIALDVSPGSSDWRTLTAASFKYGLTTGSYRSDRLAITALGQRVVTPSSPADRSAALFSAAMSPPTFKAIFDYFKGKKLPLDNYFQNTIVREFEVPKEHAAICTDLFTKNARFVGLTRTTTTGQWLGGEPSGLPSASLAEEADGTGADEVSAGLVEDDGAETFNELKTDDRDPEAGSHGPRTTRGKGQAIFLGHGRNRNPLEQLQKILNEYGIPHKVAVDEPNRGLPISEKVASVMEDCGAAILIFTADEEFRSVAGDVVWRPSENVVYELGAASVMYGRRIIIFKEHGVTFPSNFREIGYIEFEKNSLSSKAIELFRELIAFRIVQVTVPS